MDAVKKIEINLLGKGFTKSFMAEFAKPMSYQTIQKALIALKEEHAKTVELNKSLLSYATNLQKAFFSGKTDELIFDGLYNGGEVTVLTLTGKKIPINVSYTDTVETVQEKIHEKTGIPVLNQRLIFGGHRLKPHRSIYSYKIPVAGILHLVMDMHPKLNPWIPSDPKEIADDKYYIEDALKKFIERRAYEKKYPHLYKL